MSAREILIDRRGEVTRAAVLIEGRLSDLAVDNAARPTLSGAIFLGRVERVAVGLDAAFVELGVGKPGLLAAADVRGGGGKRRAGGISTQLSAGRPVLVQVKADATGAKGPSLSMDITLPGRYLIHAPFARGVTVSKRVARGAALNALLERLEPYLVGSGWIVRAAAAGALANDLADALVDEVDALALGWRAVLRAAEDGAAPRRLMEGPTAAQRALLEHGRGDVRVQVEGRALASEIGAWCAERAPDLVARIEGSRVEEGAGLFDARDLDQAVAALLEPKVGMRGGASLVIERTEAMTVIDVNAGERGNALDVNLDAATEIARQLRLRNVGGIIVVDFVNMRERADGERLLSALAYAVADDPAQTQVYGLSKLGLVEVTRARRGGALADVLANVLERET